MHPRTVGRPSRQTPVGSSSAFHSKRPTTTASRARLHSHRAAGRHRDHRDFGRPPLPRFQQRSKPSQKNTGKNDLTQIVNAVNAYYTEYGKYPLRGHNDGHDLRALDWEAQIRFILHAACRSNGLMQTTRLIRGRSSSFPREYVKYSSQALRNRSRRSANLRSVGNTLQRYDRWQLQQSVVANPYGAQT